jgi:hypothetical protein
LQEAVARGRALFAVAQAGYLATQDMLSRIADPEETGITGWVTEPEGNATAVTFYADGDDGPVAVYRGRIQGGRIVQRDVFAAGEQPALTGIAARMAAAREATSALDHQGCGGTFNVLVPPPETADAPIHVYQVRAQTARGRFPLGGHYRTIVARGGRVVEEARLTAECDDIEAPPATEGERPAPVAIAHLGEPMPNEIHVFLSLWSGRPLAVATGDPRRDWAVAGEGIVALDE